MSTGSPPKEVLTVFALVARGHNLSSRMFFGRREEERAERVVHRPISVRIFDNVHKPPLAVKLMTNLTHFFFVSEANV